MEVQWPLVLFTLLTGMGAGIFAFVTAAELLGKFENTRHTGAIAAFLTILLGSVASSFHLAHPTRVFNVLGNLNTDVGKEFLLVAIVLVILLAYLLKGKGNTSDNLKKGLAILGLIFSVLLAFEIGATYVLPARPAWSTWILPLTYLASAGVMGSFAMAVLVAKKESDRAYLKSMNKIALYSLLIQAVFTFAYLSNLDTALYLDFSILATSGSSIIFWLGVVIIGLLAPFGLTFWLTARSETTTNVALVSFLCTIVGGVAFRAMMYLIGGSVPLNL